MNSNLRNETARGYLLLFVFFIHALYSRTWQMTDWHQSPISFSLEKLLAPQIGIYFFVSGISMRGIGNKSLRAALPQSLMLIFLAWLSEGLGIVIANSVWGGFGSGLAFFKAAVKPMLYGTGGCTFVTWFFTVLAVGRMLVWLFERSRLGFVFAWAVIAAAILALRHLHAPDNLYEWRNWPAATLFMLLGMKLPRDWRVPGWVGLYGLPAGLALTWFNAPEIGSFCLTCNIGFTAEPMVGAFGFLPVFILEQLCLCLFILWAAQDPPAAIGRLARYFGRPSLQFLLLHGWLLITVIPVLTNYFPRETLALIVAIALLNPPLHAFCFKFTEPVLNRMVAFCFRGGRAATDGGYRLAGR